MCSISLKNKHFNPNKMFLGSFVCFQWINMEEEQHFVKFSCILKNTNEAIFIPKIIILFSFQQVLHELKREHFFFANIFEILISSLLFKQMLRNEGVQFDLTYIEFGKGQFKRIKGGIENFKIELRSDHDPFLTSRVTTIREVAG